LVNGVITVDGHLPGGELVEENQALRGAGDGSFLLVPEWNLGSTRSGRGMSMADLDDDGDRDIVVGNLRSSSQVFENRLCGGGHLQIDLRQPGFANTQALGAGIVLITAGGVELRLEVRAQSGYLSGDTSRLHFGMPGDATLTRLEILWPDGTLSSIANPTPNALLSITYPRHRSIRSRERRSPRESVYRLLTQPRPRAAACRGYENGQADCWLLADLIQ